LSRPILGRRHILNDMPHVIFSGKLQFYLCAELNNPIGRNSEIKGGIPGISGHKRKQGFAPWHHFRFSTGEEGFPAHIKCRGHRVGNESILGNYFHNLRHVWFLHETIEGLDPIKVLAKINQLNSFAGRNGWRISVNDGKKHHFFMQNVIVFYMMKQRRRRPYRRQCHKDGCSGNSRQTTFR